MRGWRIWRANRKDAALLGDLEQDAFDDRAWGKQSVSESFSAPGVSVLLGGRPDEAAQGFAIWRDLGGEAELLSIGVRRAQRGKGLGAALLAAAIEGARAAGGKKLFLEVDAGNVAACALYRRFGFIRAGLRRGYYRDGADAVIMAIGL